MHYSSLLVEISPQLEQEEGVHRGNAINEMVLEALDVPFGGIDMVIVGLHWFPRNIFRFLCSFEQL